MTLGKVVARRLQALHRTQRSHGRKPWPDLGCHELGVLGLVSALSRLSWLARRSGFTRRAGALRVDVDLLHPLRSPAGAQQPDRIVPDAASKTSPSASASSSCQ